MFGDKRTQKHKIITFIPELNLEIQHDPNFFLKSVRFVEADKLILKLKKKNRQEENEKIKRRKTDITRY